MSNTCKLRFFLVTQKSNVYFVFRSNSYSAVISIEKQHFSNFIQLHCIVMLVGYVTHVSFAFPLFPTKYTFSRLMLVLCLHWHISFSDFGQKLFFSFFIFHMLLFAVQHNTERFKYAFCMELLEQRYRI